MKGKIEETENDKSKVIGKFDEWEVSSLMLNNDGDLII